MDRVGIALVGCGGMAHGTHLPAIRILRDELELLAVCDRDAERAEATARQYNCRAYSDLDRMLGEEPNVAIVDVTVHAQHHHTIAVKAANAGKHVIVEKPIAITMPCAHAMLEAAQLNGVKLEVCENYPRMPMDAFINRVAASGLLGKILTVGVTDPVNGASLDIGVHRHAQLREAAGGWPLAVRAFSNAIDLEYGEAPEEWYEREFGDTEVAKWVYSLTEFDNGVLGKCEYFPLGRNAIAWAPNLREIVGQKGGLADDLWPNVWPWQETGRLTIQHWGGHDRHEELGFSCHHETIHGLNFTTHVELDADPSIRWDNPILDVLHQSKLEDFNVAQIHKRVTWPDWFVAAITAQRNFARAVREGTDPEYGPERGTNDLELCIATYEAARIGDRVTLPLPEITEHEKKVHAMFEDRYGLAIL